MIISKIVLASLPQASSYKMFSGPLPYPHHSDHVATPDTSITSQGCVVEQRNGDNKNSASDGVWEGEIGVDSWPFTVTICSQLPDMIEVSFIFEQIKNCNNTML